MSKSVTKVSANCPNTWASRSYLRTTFPPVHRRCSAPTLSTSAACCDELLIDGVDAAVAKLADRHLRVPVTRSRGRIEGIGAGRGHGRRS